MLVYVSLMLVYAAIRLHMLPSSMIHMLLKCSAYTLHILLCGLGARTIKDQEESG